METKTLIKALDRLAREIQCADGSAQATVSAAAERLRELERSVEAAQQVINDDMKIINDIKAAINETLDASADKSYLTDVDRLIKLRRMAAMPNVEVSHRRADVTK
jgi:hypothetical protein